MCDLFSQKRLAIYYGWPSSVNATYSVAGAAAVFGAYHFVVLGAGLEDPTHLDHANTVAIIAHPDMKNTKVSGYINATDSFAVNSVKVDQWALTGAAGIFVDRFGYDFAVSRAAQNQIVDYIHTKNLFAFVNGFFPDQVFGSQFDATYNPNRDATSLAAGDWALAESFAISNDVFEEKDAFITRAAALAKYKAALGVKIATITTTLTGTFDQAKFDFSHFGALAYGFDASGWGEKDFSATTALLPFRQRKRPTTGTKYADEAPELQGEVLFRRINSGFVLNFATHLATGTYNP